MIFLKVLLTYTSPQVLGPPMSVCLFFQQHPSLTKKWSKLKDPELGEEDKLQCTIEEAVLEHQKITSKLLSLLFVTNSLRAISGEQHLC
jgi:hypothetical protein